MKHARSSRGPGRRTGAGAIVFFTLSGVAALLGSPLAACGSVTPAPVDAGADGAIDGSDDTSFAVTQDVQSDIPPDPVDALDPDADAADYDAAGCMVLACPGTCQRGRCVVTLGNGGTYDLALDSTNVYWTNPGASLGAGSIVTETKDPTGAMNRTIAAAQTFPSGIVVDTTNVYWTTKIASGGAVLKAPKTGLPDGGLATSIATNQPSAAALAIDSTSLYWTNLGAESNAGSIAKAPLTGVAMDGGSADAGGATVLATGLTLPAAIAVDAQSIYWVETGTMPRTGAVLKMPLAGGAITPLAPGQNQPTTLAVDGTSVYWGQVGGMTNMGAVVKTPLAGGAVTTLVANQAQVGAITVDAEHVYWVTTSGTGTGMVLRAALDGSAVTTLIEKQNFASAIAVDDTSVYWTDDLDGTVMKVTPK